MPLSEASIANKLTNFLCLEWTQLCGIIGKIGKMLLSQFSPADDQRFFLERKGHSSLTFTTEQLGFTEETLTKQN